MATVTRKGTPVETIGELPALGTTAHNFTLTLPDLTDLSLSQLRRKNLVLNIFPSIDTPTCATSVRQFNKKATSMENVTVLCVSADLPFALGRFCGAEGIENVITASSFRSNFGTDYGVTFTTGPLKGLLSRAIIVIDLNGIINHTEQVPDISQEPNYEAVFETLSSDT